VIKRLDYSLGFFLPKTTIVHTSRTPLGSGIYGRYVEDEDSLTRLSGESVYQVDGHNCYPLQDKEHGNSIMLASIHTNRLMDSILLLVQSRSINGYESAIVEDIINQVDVSNLLTLWNIALERTSNSINEVTLKNILKDYAIFFVTDIDTVDNLTGEYICQLPINNIMGYLGFGGIIASDPYNNGWDRGCVSYDLDLAQELRGSVARF
jgi:hypothetical protein